MTDDAKARSMALVPVPEPQQPSSDAVRQPSSLQGLLKMAMDTKKDEPMEFKPMDDDRKRFLEQAIHALTIDVVELLIKQIRVLQTVSEVNEENAGKYSEAFGTILEYVCDLDTANDFHKIGGFAVLQPCMKCSNPEIRAEACNLLAELCQNNPYCQRVAIEDGYVPLLLELAESDPSPNVLVKAMYALSCIIRQNTAGCARFLQYRGVQILREVLKKQVEKATIKACFLLLTLCESQNDFVNRLNFHEYLPVLFQLLATDQNQSHEHVLRLLLKLIETGSVEFKDKEPLEEYYDRIHGKEEFETEMELCEKIKACFDKSLY